MIGALISGLGSIASGVIGANASEKNNERLIADKEEDRRLQKEFAQHGVRWKVEDAAAAGVHPLYALGANTVSYAPSSLGLQASNPASGLASAGQDISRALNTTRTVGERADAFTKTVQDLSVQKMGLENQLLSSQIAKLNQTQNPPMPSPGSQYLIDGQGNAPIGTVTPAFKDKSADRVPSAPGEPSQEGGAIADIGFARTTTGWAPVASKDIKERIEDNFIQERLFDIRNNFMPTIGQNWNPPKQDPGSGNVWVFNPFKQEYQIVPAGHYLDQIYKPKRPATFNERFVPRY